MTNREQLKSFLEIIKKNSYGNQLTIDYDPQYIIKSFNEIKLL